MKEAAYSPVEVDTQRGHVKTDDTVFEPLVNHEPFMKGIWQGAEVNLKLYK